MKNLLKVLFSINISFFIITFSISFVLLFRPFYYMHIHSLELEEKTGLSYIEIKEAYDDVIDYCIYYHPFKTGVLKYSREGKDHFHDCRVLFTINFIILLLSILVYMIQKIFFKDIKIKKHFPEWWGSIIVIGSFVSILLISLTIGFEKVFISFHKLFFMGKDNWILDSIKDPIIKILPEEYFMNCAILIFILIIIISSSFIIMDYKKNKKVFI